MKCFLHAGCEKTGTTAFQEWLKQNKKVLLSEGVFVPEWEGVCGHTSIVRMAIDRLENHRAFSKAYQKLVGDFSGSPRVLEAMLLSSEHFSSRLQRIEYIWSLKSILDSLGFSEYKIIIYIREQAHAALSLYSTFVRNGYCESVSTFVSSKYLDFVFDFNHCISMWIEVFGRTAVSVRLYPPRSYHENSLVEDIIGEFELERSAIVNTQSEFLNKKLSPECLQLLLKINKKNYPAWMVSPLPRLQLIDVLEEISQNHPKAELSSRHMRELRKKFQSSNEEVRLKFFPDRQTLFDFDEVNPPATGSNSSSDAASDYSRKLDERILSSLERALIIPGYYISARAFLCSAYAWFISTVSLKKMLILAAFRRLSVGR